MKERYFIERPDGYLFAGKGKWSKRTTEAFGYRSSTSATKALLIKHYLHCSIVKYSVPSNSQERDKEK